LRENPKTGSHEVQPDIVHVKQPGIAPQGTQTVPLKYIPGKHSQRLFSIVKLLAVSQT